MAKGKKKSAKHNQKAADDADGENMPVVEAAGPQETVHDDDVQADNLVVVEVFETRTHSKLSAGQQLVTVFDGENMYQVVTSEPVQQDDLVVYAKPGCVLPGTQQRVGTRKVNGVKSLGHICNAYEVGWQEDQTDEYLCIDEDWNMISGDVCPMGPPSGWVQQKADRPVESHEDDAVNDEYAIDHLSDDIPSASSISNLDKSSRTENTKLTDKTASRSEEAGGSQHGSKATSKVAGANAFMGLMGSDTEDSEGETTEATQPSKGMNAFAGLMDCEDSEAEDQEQGNGEGAVGAATVDGVKAGVINAFAGLMGSDVSDSSDEAGGAESVRDIDASSKAANAFAGLMASDEDESPGADEGHASAPAAAGTAKSANAFAGLVAESSADHDSTPEGQDEKVAVPSPTRQGAGNDKTEPHTNPQEVPMDSLTTVSQVKEAMEVKGISKTRKQKLKQRLKKLQEEHAASEAPADIAKDPTDMPVDELTTVEQVEHAMSAPSVSKTRKQKLKQRLKSLQDSIKDTCQTSDALGMPSEVPVDELHTIEEVQSALNDPHLSKTRRQKLKQRLKQLQDSGSKGKGKKSAAVAAMQGELEERRKAEESARQAQEERRRAEEEAELQAELEAQEREEAEQARAEAKRVERERLRKEGKLLTAKQRAEAKRLAAQREMYLARAQEVGITSGDKPSPAQLEERRRQAKKRQKELEEQRAKEKDAAEQAERQRRRQAEKEAEENRRKEAEAAAAAKLAAEVAAADNWEDEVPDEWDVSDDDAADVESDVAKGEKKASDTDMDDAGSEGSTNQDSSADDSSQEDSDSDSDWSSDSEEERERRLEEARARREARFKEAMTHRSQDDLRSPICCILGHVDTGKTKILDNVRRTNVQTGEAGGITQQIGATYIPADAVKGRTEDLRKGKVFDMKMPGLLVIDTPGHESFSNLRSRGSSLCDIAVLVIDIMHGLEQQTIESINLLKMRKSPFVIALNKIDRMYNWQVHENAPVRESLAKQEKATQEEFDTRCRDSMLALNEQGLNVELYWKNKDPRRFVNIVPTSAITGEGICDLMWLIVKLTQSMMMDRLMFVEELQCTVLEVKVVEGYGHTIDAVLINGRIREGDKVVICGLQGPIVTTVRSLLTPHPLKELRVKNTYIHHKEIKAAQGIKIAAPNLESAVAGTQLFVVGKDDDEDELKDLVMEDMSDIFDKKESEGVCVQASTLGSLEALLEFLSSDAVKIPVSGINIGPVHKKDIMRANIMNEKKLKKYSCILAFDVIITRDAQALAQSMGVTVFAADIIYHLFDMFTEYTQRCKAEEKTAAATKAVFPCRMRIVPNCVFNAKDPIVLGCEVIEGQLRIGTPITVADKDCDLGKVIGLEKDHKAVELVERGDSAAVKIEATNSVEASKLFGRHFVESDELVSKISRESIDALKAYFRDEMTRPLWELVIKLKKVFKID